MACRFNQGFLAGLKTERVIGAINRRLSAKVDDLIRTVQGSGRKTFLAQVLYTIQFSNVQETPLRFGSRTMIGGLKQGQGIGQMSEMGQ